MARLPRIVIPGLPHVVIQRGHNQQDVFVDAIDSECYVASLRDAAREAGVLVHAYGLHAHEARLLVSPDAEDALGRMMQAVGRRFVRHFNQRYRRSGTPWEGRFRSAVIEVASHFLACMRFVEAAADQPWQAHHPAGSEEPTQWSSAAHYLVGRSDALLTEHPAYWALGNTPFDREAAYRRLHTMPLGAQQVANISLAALNGWVLGSDTFADRVAEQAGRRARRVPPGRPRKPAG